MRERSRAENDCDLGAPYVKYLPSSPLPALEAHETHTSRARVLFHTVCLGKRYLRFVRSKVHGIRRCTRIVSRYDSFIIIFFFFLRGENHRRGEVFRCSCWPVVLRSARKWSERETSKVDGRIKLRVRRVWAQRARNTVTSTGSRYAARVKYAASPLRPNTARVSVADAII